MLYEVGIVLIASVRVFVCLSVCLSVRAKLKTYLSETNVGW